MTSRCAKCNAPIASDWVEVHSQCMNRLLSLWNTIQKEVSQGSAHWSWESDEIFPLLSSIIFGNKPERIYKVQFQGNNPKITDVTDEHNYLYAVLKQLEEDDDENEEN